MNSQYAARMLPLKKLGVYSSPKAFDVDRLSIFGHKEHIVGGDVTV